MTRVLIVDDEPAVRAALDRALRLDGYEIDAGGRRPRGAGPPGRRAPRRGRARRRDARHRRPAGLPAPARRRRSHAGADADRPRRGRRSRRRAGRRRRRLSGQAVRAEGAQGAPAGAAAARRGARGRRRQRPALRRPVARPRRLGGHRAARASSSSRAPSSSCWRCSSSTRSQVLTRSQIFERVWGYDFGSSSNSLGVYMGYLRRKTEEGGEPRLLHTVRGVGYVLARLMRSLPLRRRMTIAVAVAVAVAVALAAAVAYIAVRDELRGEVDRALRTSSSSASAARAPRPAVRARPPRFRRAAGGPRRADAVHPGASTPATRVAVIGTERGAAARRRPRARGRGRRRARATSPTRDVRRAPTCACSTGRRLDGGPSRVQLGPLARARRRRARAAAARSWRSSASAASRSRSRSGGSSRATSSRRSPRVTEAARHIAATEDLGRRIEVETHDEVGELAAALQRDARHARALGRRPAPARRRRLARAAHADHQPAHEHRGAGRVRRAAAPTSARGCWPTSRSRRPSSGCSSPT